MVARMKDRFVFVFVFVGGLVSMSTVAQLKQQLDDLGIAYNSKAKKDDLLALLGTE